MEFLPELEKLLAMYLLDLDHLLEEVLLIHMVPVVLLVLLLDLE
jgi:hypothetical protein